MSKTKRNGSEKCWKCRFSKTINGGHNAQGVVCDYVLIMKKMRPCEGGDKCTVAEPFLVDRKTDHLVKLSAKTYHEDINEIYKKERFYNGEY